MQFQGCLFHLSDSSLGLWTPSSLGFLCHLWLPCVRSPLRHKFISDLASPMFFWSTIHIHWHFRVCLGNSALFALCFHFHFPVGNNSIPVALGVFVGFCCCCWGFFIFLIFYFYILVRFWFGLVFLLLFLGCFFLFCFLFLWGFFCVLLLLLFSPRTQKVKLGKLLKDQYF